MRNTIDALPTMINPCDMNKQEFDNYDEQCGKFRDLILKTFKTHKFEFGRNPDTLNVEVLINNISTITLLPDNTWDEVHRNINKKINNSKDKTKEDSCSICFEEINIPVSCNKCSQYFCGECYIKLFRHNNGIITCPNCRFSFGKKTPDYMIESCIAEIREKLNKAMENKNTANNNNKIGRNGKCPCNSGKKFKKCCGLLS